MARPPGSTTNAVLHSRHTGSDLFCAVARSSSPWRPPAARRRLQGWTDPAASKYYVVVVQYTARLHSDKLRAAVMRLSGGKHGSKAYNMRLAAEEVHL